MRQHRPTGIITILDGLGQNTPKGSTATRWRPGLAVRRQNCVYQLAALNLPHAGQKAGVAQSTPLQGGRRAAILARQPNACQQAMLERPRFCNL